MGWPRTKTLNSPNTKKVLTANFIGNRRIGRPNKRLEDGLKENAANLLGCRNWRVVSQNRYNWRQNIREAKALI